VFANTHKRIMEEEVIFKEITEIIDLYYKETFWDLNDDQFREEWKENLSLTK